MNIRAGIGYDVHPLISGRKLILGGIEIPYHLGLNGHSDADVLAHAIMDALLGAAALGDIGQCFSPQDEAYRDISSTILLFRVGEMIKKEGWRISNIDATIVAEAPTLAPYVGPMRERVAEALGISKSLVGVKATSNEGLGFVGRGEGISAYAVAILGASDSREP